MTKSDYLSNSAKILLISSALLFVANLLAVMGAYNEVFVIPAEKFSTFCFYAVFLLGFLAFNGEGIAYKHSRESGNKKKTTYLKILVLFVFLVRYIKTPIENLALSLNAESLCGIVTRLLLGVFNTIFSYGFLLTIVSLWYIFRDNGIKKLLPFETCAFAMGLIYNVYKVFNYAVTKYGLTVFGELFVSVFSNKLILNSLCLLQFLLDIFMCLIVMKHYDKKAIKEQEEKSKVNKKMVVAKRIYSTDCCGIDNLEDNFFLEKKEEE